LASDQYWNWTVFCISAYLHIGYVYCVMRGIHYGAFWEPHVGRYFRWCKIFVAFPFHSINTFTWYLHGLYGLTDHTMMAEGGEFVQWSWS